MFIVQNVLYGIYIENLMKKPNNYYCHRGTSEDFTQVSGKTLQVIEKIGEGSFGEVYKVFDPKSSSLVVVKKLKRESSTSQQFKILSQLTNSQAFNRLRAVNVQSKKESEDSIIMGCLGPNTGSIMKKIKKMNIYCMKKIAYEMLHKLKEIHSRGYVHRDIKPENIVIGNKSDAHSVYLIDFGLATNYRKNVTKPRRVMQNVIGTAKYCSIASHAGLEQYPKDDLESLGYVLLFYINGQLPWDKLEAKTDLDLFDKIATAKKDSSIDVLCAGVNCLRKFWMQVKALEPSYKVDYDKLFELFDVGDPQLQNCFEFCENCWIGTQSNSIQENQSSTLCEPKPSKVRSSILN